MRHMRQFMTAVAVLTLFAAVQTEAAGWSRKYEPGVADAYAIAPMPRNGFALVTAGQSGALLLLDAAGDVRAARQLRFPPNTLTTSPDGSIFVSYSDAEATTITKLHAALDVVWSRRLAGAVRNATGTRDGGVVFEVDLKPRVFVKLRANGETEWAVTVSGGTVLRVREVGEGFVFAGTSRNNPWLASVDRAGKVRWQRMITALHSRFVDVAPAPDGGVLAAGDVGGRLMLLVRVKADGTPAWMKGIEAPPAGAIAATARGYVVTGTASGVSTPVIVGVDDAGALLWQRRFDREKKNEYASKPFERVLAAASDGAAYISPYPEQTVRVFKFDAATGDTGCAWFSSVQLRNDVAPPVAEPLGATFAATTIEIKPATWGLGDVATIAASAGICAPIAGSAQPAPAARQLDAGFEALEAQVTQWRQQWQKRDWDALEAAAATARKASSPDPMNPFRDLNLFYTTLAGIEAEAATLEGLRAWVAARPQSVTARVALAKALHEAAWRHRGRGTNPSVTPQQSAEYRQLVQQSLETLSALGRAGESDPYYWQLSVTLAGETGGDVKAIARRGLAAFANPLVAWNAANYLLPMWDGSAQDVLAWADEAVRITRPTYGEALYFPLALHLYNTTDRDRRKGLGIDWPRLKRAAEAMIAKQPKWVPTYHQYAELAFDFNDRETAKALFERPELAWYQGAESIWRVRGDYDEIRKWALTGQQAFQPAEPPPAPTGALFVRQDPKSWPRVVTGSNGAASFIAETPSGRVRVTAGPASGNGTLGVATKLDGKAETATVPVFWGATMLRDRRVFIAGCKWTGTRCDQFVVEGLAYSSSSEGRPELHVKIKEAMPRNSFRGALVINDNGFAIGVANERDNVTALDGTFVVIADELSHVISRMIVPK